MIVYCVRRSVHAANASVCMSMHQSGKSIPQGFMGSLIIPCTTSCSPGHFVPSSCWLCTKNLSVRIQSFSRLAVIKQQHNMQYKNPSPLKRHNPATHRRSALCPNIRLSAKLAVQLEWIRMPVFQSQCLQNQDKIRH